ncbi:nuclear transport factor 2 family protein [Nocardioides sp. LHG3406-4]|uniref:nuclear transport factor 2 family protein n=1 Tax=Nocardioides sp. LHG3406-4 TaxID=2804575 RepID=UPI003CEA9D10
MSEVEEFVRRYYTTVDTLGAVETVALFTPDAVYRRPGYAEMKGRDALAHFYGAERVIAGGQHTVESILADGASAAVRGTFRGVLRDGQDVEVGFADFMRFEYGLIADRTTYFYSPAV